jgi:NAD(P)-dependent dehydrogenase (short-subunit alcohol dehydrogenase family)
MKVLVTGGTGGLGLAMASALATAGATVALTGRSGERASSVAAELPGAVGIELDVREESSVARAVDQAWSRLGGIDMLVNNAGIGMRTVNPRFMTHPQGFWEVPVDGFRAVIETNLTGYFLVAREVTPRMLAAGGGRIVNISVSHSTCTEPGSSPTGRRVPAARHCPGSWPPTCGTRALPSTCCCPGARPSPECCPPMRCPRASGSWSPR